MYTSILVPVDGSEFSEKAVKEAARLAQALGSKLLLFYAAPHYHLLPLTEGLSPGNRPEEKAMARKEMEDWAKSLLAEAARKANLADGKVEQHFVMSDSPYEAILLIAKKFKCDLIVMASHGRRGVSGVLLGSETQKVLTHSKVPVLVVR